MNSQFRAMITYFWPSLMGKTIAYMLQSTEYMPGTFLRWFWRTNDFSRNMYRRQLVPTTPARIVRIFVTAGITGQMLLAAVIVYVGLRENEAGLPWFGLALFVSAPVLWAHLSAGVLWLARIVIAKPAARRHAAEAAALLQSHPGIRVAIAGSYGKTSMKELLLTVLSEGKSVAATPANMNVLSSHARFARSLKGNEDIVLVEFGEGQPGDVEMFAEVVEPEYAIITGLAPAHLDRYKTLDAAGQDIFSIARTVDHEKLYVNADSAETHAYLPKNARIYTRSTVLGWHVQKANTSIDGTSFELVKGKKRLKLRSKLIGMHQVGPLAFAAAFGLLLGLTEKQVIAGIAKTQPFEHRMQPYKLAGAWVIDDTYNGNLEGIKAGTELLGQLKAKQRIYVTPGLVDQGKESPAIHRKVGLYIAAAKPDKVVLMKNSVFQHIQTGLQDGGYEGELQIVSDPLKFYQNLDHTVATGDVILMQNDWTDNYH